MEGRKKKKILLVQFPKASRRDKEYRCLQRYLKSIELRAIDAFNPKVEFSQPKKLLKGTDGVILGGSAFNFASPNPDKEEIFWSMVKRVRLFIHYLIEKDITTLGICFGHQFLGHLIGAQIVNDRKQREIGSCSVFLTREGKKDPLFLNLPPVFISQAGHKDSLKTLPPKATLLARTKRCKIAAFRYKNNIYGIQFHPELTFKDIVSRLKQYPDYIFGKKISDINKTLKPSPYSPRIFKNFLKIINAH